MDDSVVGGVCSTVCAVPVHAPNKGPVGRILQNGQITIPHSRHGLVFRRLYSRMSIESSSQIQRGAQQLVGDITLLLH
jgi:hypothetical protein